MSQEKEQRQVQVGKTVYDAEGEKLGVVRGFDQHGFYVTADSEVETLADGPKRQGQSDALMWRCWECGEMGQITDVPEQCPSCGAPKEDIYYWQED